MHVLSMPVSIDKNSNLPKMKVMTLPSAPLPQIRSLLRAFTTPPTTGESWSHGFPTRVIRLYWRGRLALAAGIKAIQKARKADRLTVLAPDFFCDDALENVRQLPAKLKFYPIQEDLTPNWIVLEDWIKRSKGVQVFILVHYFGFPNVSTEARLFCDKHGLVLFEDCAHILRLQEGMGIGDLLIFSCYKFMAVPSGSILMIPKDLEEYLEDESSLPIAHDALPWLAKRLTQKLLVSSQLPWHFLRKRDHQQIPCEPCHPVAPRVCDPYTLRLIKTEESALLDISGKRRRNYQIIASLVDHLPRVNLFFPQFSEEICPYVFPLQVTVKTDRILENLESHGIPVGKWPKFALEVLKNPVEHQVAIRTHQSLLLLPIHQSLSMAQIEHMGHCLKQATIGN